jgi:integrase
VIDNAGKLTFSAPTSEDLPLPPLSLRHRVTQLRGEAIREKTGGESRISARDNTWATWHRQSGTPTHELQRLGGWRSSVMVERYAHLAPDHLAKAANRLDSVFGGYVSATSETEKGSAQDANPL